MPITHLPRPPLHPAILLVEPETSRYSERAGQLENSHYRVTSAATSRDVFLMGAASSISVAVLSDTVGSPMLAASARMVRSQWPKARILILGRAPARFEDQLYDEAIDHGSTGAALLMKVHTLSEEYWARRGEPFIKWIDSISGVSHPVAGWAIPESDPRKTQASQLATEEMRDWPDSVQRFRGLSSR